MNKTNLFKAITACVMAFVMVIVIVPFANNVHAIDTSKEAEKALEDKIDTLQNEQAELKKKLEASKTNEAETHEISCSVETPPKIIRTFFFKSNTPLIIIYITVYHLKFQM